MMNQLRNGNLGALKLKAILTNMRNRKEKVKNK